MDPPWSSGFSLLPYFEKILPLVERLCYALQNEVYIMGCSATKEL